MGVGAAVGGAVFSAVGNYQSGKYNKSIADSNAAVAEWKAKDAIARGEKDVYDLRTQIKGLIGKQRAGYAGQGVDVNEGTAADIQAQTAYLGELDAITLRNNAAREAYGYRVQGWNYSAQGKMAKFEGTAGAVGSLLTLGKLYPGTSSGGKK